MDQQLSPKDHVIIALDVADMEQAARRMDLLAGHVGTVKIGHELVTAIGAPAAVGLIKSYDTGVMLDLKFHDIPQTMAAAAKAAAALQTDFFTVHAMAGVHGLDATSAGLRAYAKERAATGMDFKLPTPLAVTVLTSLSEEEHEVMYHRPLPGAVQDFAHLAADKSMGIICAPTDLPLLREWRDTRTCVLVTPGVRPIWYGAGDQARFATPGAAIKAGADYIVVGRPILQPPAGMTVVDAVRRILDEVDVALA